MTLRFPRQEAELELQELALTRVDETAREVEKMLRVLTQEMVVGSGQVLRPEICECYF